MWSLKRNDTDELTYKKRERERERERLIDLGNEFMGLLVGGMGEGIVREFGKVMYTLL